MPDWFLILGQCLDYLVWILVFIASLWALISESKRYLLQQKYDKLEWEYQCLAEQFESMQEQTKPNKTR